MPVTIKIAAHEASIIPDTTSQHAHAPSPIDIVNHVLADTGSDAQRKASSLLPPIRTHIESSFDSTTTPQSPFLIPDSNGFVHTITRAYNNHHHVTIRPDDIWMAIITQFSFYVNAHSEDLRGKFVAHEGKVFLEVDYASMADFAAQMAGLIERNVVDPDLRRWLLPGFTTATVDDTIAASVVMMGTLQAYFEYGMSITCGIPSVTLLGEKRDYEEILTRLDKLSEYGEEPAEFRAGLVPVLEGMVRTFDDPKGEEVKRFWVTICDYEGGSGMDYYSGWVIAFCFWDDKGGRLERVGDEGQINVKDIPGGFATVPLKINDSGVEIDGELLAGSVAIACSSSGKLSLANGSKSKSKMVVGLDSMQPRIGWFLYGKREAFGPVYDERAAMLQRMKDDPKSILYEYLNRKAQSGDSTE